MKKRLFAFLLCVVMLSALLPTAVSAANEKYVTQITITDVTAPVPGAAPNGNFTIETNGLSKTKDGSWYNVTDNAWMEGEPFEAGKTYKFYAYVDIAKTARREWPSSLSGIKATINGMTASVHAVGHASSYKSVELEFVCTAVISAIGVTGVTEPVAGAKPNNSFTVTGVGVKKARDGEWYNVTDDKAMNGEPFEAGKYYRFNAYVEADHGFEWPLNHTGMTVKMNGLTAGITVFYDKPYISVRHQFICAASPVTTVTSIDITGVTEPAAGAVPNNNFTVTTGGVKKAQDGKWFNVTDNKWMNGEAFEGGKTYEFDAFVDVESGYVWPENTTDITAVMNGKAVEFIGVSSSFYYCVYSQFVCPGSTTQKYTLTAKVEGGHGTILTGSSVTLNAGETTTVIFVPDDGYMIDKVTINGKTVGVLANVLDVTLDENKTLIVTYIKVPDVTVLNSVTVTGIKSAEVGRTASETLSVPDGSPYYISDYCWFNDTDVYEMSGTDRFEEGPKYSLYVEVKTQPGYALSDDVNCEFKDVRGNSVAIVGHGYHTDSDSYYFMTGSMFAEPAGTGNIDVTSISVAGIKPVEAGRTASETFIVPEGSHYYISRYYWYGPDGFVTGDDQFEAGKEYSLHIQIIAEPGYTLSHVTSCELKDVSGNSMALQDSGGYVENGDYYYIMSEPVLAQGGSGAEKITVTSISVAGVTEPVAGAIPRGSFRVETNGVKAAETGAWYNVTDSVWQNDDPFEEGKIYTFFAYVDAEAGYSWPESAGDVTATMNGEAAVFGSVYGKVYKCVYYDQFVCREAYPENVITFVTVTGVTEPVAGAVPNRNFTVETNGVKFAETGAWYNVTDDEWQDDAPFEAGKTYEFDAYIDVEDGFLWPDNVDDVTGTINGKPAAFAHIDGESYNCVYCQEFVCAASAPDDSGTGTQGTEPGEIAKNPSLGWLWLLIALVVIGGGTAAFFIVKNKKRSNIK